jgi:hypothetical protein
MKPQSGSNDGVRQAIHVAVMCVLMATEACSRPDAIRYGQVCQTADNEYNALVARSAGLRAWHGGV